MVVSIPGAAEAGRDNSLRPGSGRTETVNRRAAALRRRS
jgi:hypothetical protein